MMSWEQAHERGDKLEINEAVGKLLQSFNYDTIVAQPTKYVHSHIFFTTEYAYWYEVFSGRSLFELFII